MKYDGQFSITGWDEESVGEMPAPMKFNRGQVERLHKGVLNGVEVMQYTFIYADAGRSEFAGVGVFDGSVNGVDGKYAVTERGGYKDGAVTTRFEVRLMTAFDEVVGVGEYVTGEHAEIGYVFTC